MEDEKKFKEDYEKGEMIHEMIEHDKEFGLQMKLTSPQVRGFLNNILVSVKEDFVLKTEQFSSIMKLTKNSLVFALKNIKPQKVERKTIKNILLNNLSPKNENAISKAIMRKKNDMIQFMFFASL